MLSSAVFFKWNFHPFWHLDTFFGKDADDAGAWLCTVVEVFLNLFFIQNSSFGVWVVAADLSDDTTRKRVTLRFLDDYPIKRESFTGRYDPKEGDVALLGRLSDKAGKLYGHYAVSESQA